MSFNDSLQAMLGQMSARLTSLLAADPDWKATAEELASMLENNDPDWTSPAAFVASLRPQLLKLAPQAIKTQFDPASVDSPIDLVNNLLPSDHHAD